MAKQRSRIGNEMDEMDEMDRELEALWEAAENAANRRCATLEGARDFYYFRRNDSFIGYPGGDAGALLEAAKRYAAQRDFFPDRYLNKGWENADMLLKAIALDEPDVARQAMVAWQHLDMAKTGGGRRVLTVESAAERKHVAANTLYRILNDDERRARFFPGAFRVHQGRNNPWRIPVEEVEAWEPDARGQKGKRERKRSGKESEDNA